MSGTQSVMRHLLIVGGALLCLAAFALAESQAAQHPDFKIFGFVGEETGQAAKRIPISGADLQLKPINAMDGSNASGDYQFKGVAKGKYTLTVKADNYMSSSRPVDLKADARQDFFLWPQNPGRTLS